MNKNRLFHYSEFLTGPVAGTVLKGLSLVCGSDNLRGTSFKTLI